MIQITDTDRTDTVRIVMSMIKKLGIQEEIYNILNRDKQRCVDSYRGVGSVMIQEQC